MNEETDHEEIASVIAVAGGGVPPEQIERIFDNMYKLALESSSEHLSLQELQAHFNVDSHVDITLESGKGVNPGIDKTKGGQII